jgi:hypothetical protein
MEDGVKLALASAGILAGLTFAFGAEATWGSRVTSDDFQMEMDKSLVIHTPVGALVSLTAPGGKAVGNYSSFSQALEAATAWIGSHGRRDILHVDEKGNVDLVDHHGNIIVSWA